MLSNNTMPVTHPPTESCPHPDMRKTVLPGAIPDTMIEQDADGVWHIYGFEEVRQVLRSEVVQQAGFGAEFVMKRGRSVIKNAPILYLEGEEHHRARRETNKFFTPTITQREYDDFMADFADSLMARLQHKKQLDLSELTMEMSTQVAAQIVGLTNSLLPGIRGRLEALIKMGDRMLNGMPSIMSALSGQWNSLSFYLLDVLPAIRARRKQPKEDVISYLISREYSGLEILTECVVYGVAGMVTTREFISVALWHLLENPQLAERMRVGGQEERYAILHEILRLEPVVGGLWRRTTNELTLTSAEQTVTISAGSLLNLHITAANVDGRAVGAEEMSLCPAREMVQMSPKVPAPAMSFGDGAHRCPGAYVAIQESDIFIRKLLALPGLRMERKPDVKHFKIAESYELRNFILRVD